MTHHAIATRFIARQRLDVPQHPPGDELLGYHECGGSVPRDAPSLVTAAAAAAEAAAASAAAQHAL